MGRVRPSHPEPPVPPRVVLGIVDGLHDAGAAVVVEGRLLSAANEERFTRVKLAGGMPTRSIAAVLETAGLSPRDIEVVAVGGLGTPTVATRWCRPLQRIYARSLGICFDRPWHPVDRVGDLVRYRLPLTRSRADRGGRWESRLAAPAIQRRMPRGLRNTPLQFVDHHLAHAESAWRTAPAGDWLVLTADAHGDGRSLTAWQAPAEATKLQPLLEVGVDASLGAFYSYVTRALGFRPGRHEGKVLGLSASGVAARIPVDFPFRWTSGRLVYSGAWGLAGSRWLRTLATYAREDVAAWVQAGTEAILLELVDRLLETTGLHQVALAGGVFANVSLNGKIALRRPVEALHVFPHMGDGGLAVGAALHVAARAPHPLDGAMWGPTLDPDALAGALRRAGLPWSRPPDPDLVLVRALLGGHAVARCVGRLELGPRALGHRSVLAPAGDPAISRRLNAALCRDDFMPFAPVLREEDADQVFPAHHAAWPALRYMAVALPTTAAFRAACPAAVHVDGTARAQVVRAGDDPELHALLTRYVEQSGTPALINTSFNLHEEPIVHTAHDALRAFRRAGLGLMRLGPFIVRGPEGDFGAP